MPEQFRLIQRSWQLIKRGQFKSFQEQALIPDPLGFWRLQFYETLFDFDSALRPMFKNKFNQSRMLTEMVDTALGFLPGTIDHALGSEKKELDPKLISILIDLIDLAKRHVSYKVKVGHYEPVGLTLVTALETAREHNFDEKTKTAWIGLWSLICSVMISAHVEQAQEIGVDP